LDSKIAELRVIARDGAGETTIHLDRWNDREQPHGHIAKRTASPKRRDNAVATITESERQAAAAQF
jgi:hypothetical protein